MARTFMQLFGAADTSKTSSFRIAPSEICALLHKVWHRTDGATAVEYGLLAGLIAIGLAGGLGALADLVNLLFEVVGDETATVADSMTDD